MTKSDEKKRRNGSWGGARPGAGPKPRFDPLRLAVVDADLLRTVIGDDLDDALRRIAAAAAADPAGTRAALAPLQEIAGWDGKKIL